MVAPLDHAALQAVCEFAQAACCVWLTRRVLFALEFCQKPVRPGEGQPAGFWLTHFKDGAMDATQLAAERLLRSE